MLTLMHQPQAPAIVEFLVSDIRCHRNMCTYAVAQQRFRAAVHTLLHKKCELALVQHPTIYSDLLVHLDNLFSQGTIALERWKRQSIW